MLVREMQETFFEGPTVELPDAVEDVEALLNAIYIPSYILYYVSELPPAY